LLFDLVQAGYKFLLHFCRRHQNQPPKALLRPSLEDCAVGFAIPVLRCLPRIVIGGKGNAGIWRGRADGNYAVKTDLACFEYDAAIECGCECLTADFNVLIPELNVSAPGIVPDRVKIQEQVEAAMKLAVLDKVKINMDVKPSTRSSQVHSTPDQLLVSEQIWDASHVG